MPIVIQTIISCSIFTLIEIYMWQSLMEKSIKYKWKTILLVFLLILISVANCLLIPNILRIAVIFSVYVLVNYLLFKENFGKTIISVFIAHSMSIFAEIVFLTIASKVLNLDLNTVVETNIGKLLANMIMAIISIIIFLTPITKIIYKKLLNFVNTINSKSMIGLFFILIIVTNVLLFISYYKISAVYLLILNSLIILIYLYLTYKFLEEQNKNINIKLEYDNLLDKSVEYEKIIDKNRRDTHENRNDLIVLDSLISSKNKKAKEQLHAMIKDYDKNEKELRGNDDLYKKTLPIPSGGLRGLIYHKLLKIEDSNIQYDLRIGRNINSKNLKNVDSKTIRQFGKIVGIYLDNAIGAVKDLDEKLMDVEIFIEDHCFCILVANNFQGKLDLEEFGKMGYSSKGGVHGYGLSLSKEILKENKCLTSETSIYKDILTQIIKIKM